MPEKIINCDWCDSIVTTGKEYVLEDYTFCSDECWQKAHDYVNGEAFR